MGKVGKRVYSCHNPNENFESWNEYTLHVLKRHEVYIDAHVHLEGFFHLYVVYYNIFFFMSHGIT
jgi:hypothetical protein